MKKFMNFFGILFFVLGCIGIGLFVAFYFDDRKESAANIGIQTVICWMGFVITGLIWGVHEELEKIYRDLQNLLKKWPKLPEP